MKQGFIQHLENVWQQFPNQRFGEFLCNVLEETGVDNLDDLFFLNEEQFECYMEEYLAKSNIQEYSF